MHKTALQTKSKGYSWLDLSQVYSLAERFNLFTNQAEDVAKLSQIIDYVVSTVSAEVSGIILGPEIGFEAVLKKAAQTGLILTLEKQSELLAVNEMPKFYEHWGIEQIRNNYGAAHFKFYYHPQGDFASEKKQLAGELYDAAKYEGIDLTLELAMYPLDKENNQTDVFEEAQLFAAKEFQPVCDLLVLEYPHSPLACATLTAELDVPWLLADRVEDYSYFKDILRIALENGAAGSQVNSVIWSGLSELKLDQYRQGESEDWKTLEKYVQTELRDRLIEILRIIDETKIG